MFKNLLTIYDLEIALEKGVKQAENVLAIGETDMDFDYSYKNNLENWRFKKLHGINSNIIGLDYNKTNVESARKVSNLDIRYGDVQDINTLKENLGDSKFDLIIMMDVVEHLSNIGESLGNLKEFLAPGGKLLVTVPNPRYFQYIARLFMRKSPHIMPDHTNFTTPTNMMQLLDREGLKLEYYNGIHFLPRDLNMGYIKKNLLKVIQWWNPLFLNHYIYIITA